MDNRQQHIERIRAWAYSKGYTKAQIDQGIAYAIEQGAGNGGSIGNSEIATLMMSRILFSDEQLRDGKRYNLTHQLP